MASLQVGAKVIVEGNPSGVGVLESYEGWSDGCKDFIWWVKMPQIEAHPIRYPEKAIKSIMEPKQMSTFKVGDRVRILREPSWTGPGRILGRRDNIGQPWGNEGRYYGVEMDDGRTGGWYPEQLELISSKPQFKKGDKLRLTRPNTVSSYGPGPWYLHSIGKDNYNREEYRVTLTNNGDWTHGFPTTDMEPWDKQEKPMTDAQKMHRAIADNKSHSLANVVKHYTDADPLGQRTSKPVNCAICNKEYTTTNDVGDIIGGCVLDGPVRADASQNEEMVIGPCCYPRIMDTIMSLKTQTNIPTDRKNATNSWMPHDEEGNL